MTQAQAIAKNYEQARRAYHQERAAILNSTNGKKYPFERLYTVGISRRTFYRHRQRFLDDVASELNRHQ